MLQPTFVLQRTIFYHSVLLRFINVEKLRSVFVVISFTMFCYALYFSIMRSLLQRSSMQH